VVLMGERHRAVVWILTSFKEHRSNRMDPILRVSSAPEPDAERVIGDGLSAFNDATVRYADRVPLHVLVSDPGSGKVVGGITGRTSLGLMFIDLVYLPENLRGRDIGARMMALAEEEARRRCCRAGVLYTISFQAPGFYKRLGWRVFGEIPCDPPGTSLSFSPKIFTEAVNPAATAVFAAGLAEPR
jgi:GNAT superfamily N-acetyltransferase